MTESEQETDEVSRSPEEARIRKLEERMTDMVHAAGLRELIKEWRARADKEPDVHGEPHERKRIYRECADELEAFLDER